MEWIKKGLVWGPDGSKPWARHSALQPTALVLEDRIRVFAGVRDGEGIARIVFVDVDIDDPSRVVGVSENPVLDIGDPGCFDDNGVVPCAVVHRDDGRVFLYYGGYQIPKTVKFIAFGGLAVSEDGGDTFRRYSDVPVLDRTDDDLLFRAAHCVLFDDGVWKLWYGAGSAFITNDNGYPLPKYGTRYVESNDGIHPNGPGIDCLVPDDVLYRVGRASVIRTGDALYRMFYVWATTQSGMQLGYAESHDGRQWTRKDDELGLVPTADGFDSRHMSHPNVVKAREKTFLFYNGNDYGRQGFGCAELLSW